MKVWVVREGQKTSMWSFNDKPMVTWITKSDFILRGLGAAIDEEYGKDTKIEKLIGRKLKDNEIIEFESEMTWINDVC